MPLHLNGFIIGLFALHLSSHDLEVIISNNSNASSAFANNHSEALDSNDIETQIDEIPVNSQNATPEEKIISNDLSGSFDIDSFEEWKKNQLLSHRTKIDSSLSSSSNRDQKKQNRFQRTNFASTDCGAKVIQHNSQAKNAMKILSENVDRYMLNPCKADIWFVVELCEQIQVTGIDVASYEMFANLPKTFRVSVSERFPPSDWNQYVLGTFTAENARGVHSFNVSTNQASRHVYAKFVRFDMLEHYGNQHYCPLTLIRVFGSTMEETMENAEDNVDHVNSGTIDRSSFTYSDVKNCTYFSYMFSNVMSNLLSTGYMNSFCNESKHLAFYDALLTNYNYFCCSKLASNVSSLCWKSVKNGLYFISQLKSKELYRWFNDEKEQQSNSLVRQLSNSVVSNAVTSPVLEHDDLNLTSFAHEVNTTNGSNATTQTFIKSSLSVDINASSPSLPAFLRFGNRLNSLELNVSLTNRYLEELSKHYRKQIDEMQKTVTHVSEARQQFDSLRTVYVNEQKETRNKSESLEQRVSKYFNKITKIQILLLIAFVLSLCNGLTSLVLIYFTSHHTKQLTHIEESNVVDKDELKSMIFDLIMNTTTKMKDGVSTIDTPYKNMKSSELACNSSIFNLTQECSHFHKSLHPVADAKNYLTPFLPVHLTNSNWCKHSVSNAYVDASTKSNCLCRNFDIIPDEVNNLSSGSCESPCVSTSSSTFNDSKNEALTFLRKSSSGISIYSALHNHCLCESTKINKSSCAQERPNLCFCIACSNFHVKCLARQNQPCTGTLDFLFDDETKKDAMSCDTHMYLADSLSFNLPTFNKTTMSSAFQNITVHEDLHLEEQADKECSFVLLSKIKKALSTTLKFSQVFPSFSIGTFQSDNFFSAISLTGNSDFGSLLHGRFLFNHLSDSLSTTVAGKSEVSLVNSQSYHNGRASNQFS